jgi:hypothetical protein
MLLAIVEAPQSFRQLTVYPIVASDGPQLPYLLLAEALGEGVVNMEEKPKGAASVLVAHNRGLDPILILDRERLLGARRESMIDRSILLPPSSVTEIPLACDQRERWNAPPRCAELEVGLEVFPRLQDQVGAVAFLGHRLLGLDALGSPNLYAPLHRRLLSGYIQTALESDRTGPRDPNPDLPDVTHFAHALQNAIREPCSGQGHGEQWVLTGSIRGRELCDEGFLVHLAVFPRGMAA